MIKNDKINHDKIAEGVKIRSKCFWYQYGEKPKKFFYGLEEKMQHAKL